MGKLPARHLPDRRDFGKSGNRIFNSQYRAVCIRDHMLVYPGVREFPFCPTHHLVLDRPGNHQRARASNMVTHSGSIYPGSCYGLHITTTIHSYLPPIEALTCCRTVTDIPILPRIPASYKFSSWLLFLSSLMVQKKPTKKKLSAAGRRARRSKFPLASGVEAY